MSFEQLILANIRLKEMAGLDKELDEIRWRVHQYKGMLNVKMIMHWTAGFASRTTVSVCKDVLFHAPLELLDERLLTAASKSIDPVESDLAKQLLARRQQLLNFAAKTGT